MRSLRVTNDGIENRSSDEIPRSWFIVERCDDEEIALKSVVSHCRDIFLMECWTKLSATRKDIQIALCIGNWAVARDEDCKDAIASLEKAATTIATFKQKYPSLGQLPGDLKPPELIKGTVRPSYNPNTTFNSWFLVLEFPVTWYVDSFVLWLLTEVIRQDTLGYSKDPLSYRKSIEPFMEHDFMLPSAHPYFQERLELSTNGCCGVVYGVGEWVYAMIRAAYRQLLYSNSVSRLPTDEYGIQMQKSELRYVSEVVAKSRRRFKEAHPHLNFQKLILTLGKDYAQKVLPEFRSLTSIAQVNYLITKIDDLEAEDRALWKQSI